MNCIKGYKKAVKSLLTSILLLFFNFSFAQSSPFTLDFVNGISSPMGDFKDFAASGFKSGFVVNKTFCDKLAIGLNTSYAALPLKNNTAASNEKWSSFTMSIGPQYQIDIKNVFVQFYGQLGLSFINIPEVTEYYPKTDLIATNIKESNSSGLNTSFGINLGTEICKGLHLFVSTEYNTNVNGDINAQTRDFSSATSRNGEVDPDLASQIPIKNSVFSFSTINVNFGIRLNLNNTTQKATSHNASRSNRSNNSIGNSGDGTDDEDSDIVKAQDHNASRSNTTSSAIAKPDGDTDDEDSDSQKAQDHNASKSNTTSSAIEKPDGDGDTDDEDSDSQKAQDHNASRSNTTSSAIEKPDGDTDDEDLDAAKVQDHNSTRSNVGNR